RRAGPHRPPLGRRVRQAPAHPVRPRRRGIRRGLQRRRPAGPLGRPGPPPPPPGPPRGARGRGRPPPPPAGGPRRGARAAGGGPPGGPAQGGGRKSPFDTRALSAGQDRTVRLWDVEAGEQVRVFGGHAGAVWALAAAPDGRWFVSAGEDRVVKRGELGSGRLL